MEIPLINNGMTYDIDWDLFTKKAKAIDTKMLILCSPHNPCGRIWTREELTKISEICLANDILVVAETKRQSFFEMLGEYILDGFKFMQI